MINNIIQNKDKYKYDEVNCFEKPIGIVLDRYNEAYSHLFYMCLKMVKTYHIESYYLDSKDIDSMELIKSVIKNEFNLILQCEKSVDNLHKFIQDKLENETAVLIPGNLKELFYFKYYKRENWPHLFILKGYDNERKIYNILDSLQNTSENITRYDDFYIEYNTMEKVYKSYEDSFESSIWYIEDSKNEKTDNMYKIISIIDNCLQLYINNSRNKCYSDFVKYIASYNSAKFEDYFEYMIKNTKWKKVFYEEVGFITQKYLNNNHLYEELVKNKDDLINYCQKVINKIQISFYRRKPGEFKQYLNEIIRKENKILNTVIKIRNYLLQKKSQLLEENLNLDNSGIFENNEDLIISKTKSDEYIFKFTTGKTYDSWFRDNSPKVIIKKIDNTKETSMEVKLSLLKYSDISKFHTGIFIRTKSNELYFWGINCGRTIRLDQVGINDNLCDIKMCDDILHLRIQIKKGLFIVEYSIGEKRKYIQAKKIKLLNSATQIGIGCKTWGADDEVIVKFDEILLETI